jgi:glycosyltransferase A (GT-A) superfamily protein (DUF2064 family)
MPRTLIVFAREPVAGRSKTRLCPPLDGATAAAMYECFLRDTIAIAQQVRDARLTIAYTPESDGSYFARLALGVDARPQVGVSLGERMDNAFADVFDQRSTPNDADPATAANASIPLVLASQRSVVLIGSDIPHMPLDHLHEAFARLDSGADLVLGPAEDGGYYLIGLRTRQTRLLREVPMSTPTVLADTLALADELSLRAERLPICYDIDTATDLARLAYDLQSAPTSVAPNTRRFLRHLHRILFHQPDVG